MHETIEKRVLVISDSLALPRNRPERTLYEETYPFLLQNHFTVLQLSYGGGTIKEILHQASYYTSYNPDVVIIQSGIVDCAYRAFPLFVDKGATYSKILYFYKRVIARIIPPRFLRRHLRIRYTSPSEFKLALDDLKSKFAKSIIVAVGIVPASDEYEKLVPGIKKSIIQYNTIIKDSKSVDYFIDLGKMSLNCVMSDHHHINKNGHLYIFKAIESIFNNAF